MGWTVKVAETTTGLILAELPFTGLSWSDTLDYSRGTSLSVTIPLESRAEVTRIRGYATGTWRNTLIAFYDGVPVVAAPLVSYQVDAPKTSVSFACSGPAALLAARLVITPGYEMDPMNDAADVLLMNTTLWNIARELIDNALTGSGRDLPMELPVYTAAETVGDSERTYLASEAATVNERLTQLSQVDNGPDVHLRPRLSADERYFWWDVRIGRPFLGDESGLVAWTLGGNCTEITEDCDATAQAHRVLTPGQTVQPSFAGAEDAEAEPWTPIGTAEDLTQINYGWPLLERTDRARGTTESVFWLSRQSEDYLRAFNLPAISWGVKARCGWAPKVGTFDLGGPATLKVFDDRWIPDGEYPMRITSMSGDASETFTLGVVAD